MNLVSPLHVQLRNKEGLTALHVAARYNKAEEAKELLLWAPANLLDDRERTAAQLAALRGHCVSVSSC